MARQEDAEYWVPLEEMILEEGDSVRVAEGGFMDLQFGEMGPVVRFAEEAECRLAELGFEEGEEERILHIVIDLAQGRVAADLTGLAGGATFFVRTGYWVVHGEGAVFEARADGSLVVEGGEVRVDVPEGERFKVGPNECYSV